MAEPIRKCARCRLRVQGVRPYSDGHSYCGRCYAQVESLAQGQQQEHEAEAPPPQADELPQPARAGGLHVTTKTPTEPTEPTEPVEQPAAEPTAEPATSAAAQQPEPPAAPPLSDRERTITGAVAGSAGALGEALTREREELQRRRRELVAQLELSERDLAAVDDSLGHVAALLDPAAAAPAGRAARSGRARRADRTEAA